MRRLIAVLSLLTLTNLVFVMGSSACPLGGLAHEPETAAVGGAGHAGHDMGASGHQSHQVNADDETQADDCLTMGPCALTLDLATADADTAVAAEVARMVAVSDHRPSSASAAPELPPPRA